MNVIEYPKAFQSAFRPTLFVLDGVTADDGMDVAVLPATGVNPLGVKRIYGDGRIAVNAAPYVRSLLSPQPLCGQPAGMILDQKRCAGCRISAAGYTSATVYLTAGTEDAPSGKILSAAPETVKIRPGEKDEISITVSENDAKPLISFTHGGGVYTLDSLTGASGTGLYTFLVDSAEIANLFAAKTGADPSEMQEFTVTIRMAGSSGGTDIARRYLLDYAPHNGRRLAWVNRYGAIDYYTFPIVSRKTETGNKERIATGGGMRVVATSAAAELTLESECETAETLCWIAEIYSSPRVWTIEGSESAEVDAAGSPASFDPRLPGRLSVKITSVEPVVSRKF